MMEEHVDVEEVMNEFIIEQLDLEPEEPAMLDEEIEEHDTNVSKKRRKQSAKKSNASNEKPTKNSKKKTTKKPKKSEDKRSIMNKKKSYVKAKVNNSIVVVNCDSDNEDEYVCYPEINVISQETLEDSNGENKDPLDSESAYNEFIDEIYVKNEHENLIAEDEKMVENYLSQECCARKCNTKFKCDELLRYRIELQTLDYNENGVNQLDLVLLGLIHSLCRISNEIKHSRTVEIKDRRRVKMMFAFRGVSVCRAMFMFAHGIKIERLKRLIKRYKENGISPKAHGNYKRVPANAISIEQMREVISFLKQYADDHAAVVKGRSAHQNQDIKILPPHETKSRVFNKYKQICEKQNTPCISVVSFRRLWNRFCPNVLIQRSNSAKGQNSTDTEETTEIVVTE
ncbi:uncharacterized protein LOC135836679 [Planococcus citri]|uniref:uncharacterized protein LOC135836679 n=1 Tax=Planococcus citri TaxID=170843 RepID=UPI0031FA2181